MATPYVGFTNATLSAQPRLRAGDSIICPTCGASHEVAGGTSDGQPSELLLFYVCGGSAYLAAVAGRAVGGVKADVSGEV